MSWYKYKNFEWLNLLLLSVVVSLLVIAFFRNSETQIESVTITSESKQSTPSNQAEYENRLKKKMEEIIDRLNSKVPAKSLDYTFDSSAYWVIARKGKIMHQSGKKPNLRLTTGWQKHFMLGAYLGRTNPEVFESKCLRLLQQPISYEEFANQQLQLHSIQIGFNNIAYCYLEKNSLSILVILSPNPLSQESYKLKKLPLSNPTVDFSFQALLISLLIFALLVVLQKTFLGFWIRRKFSRQYALFYFSLLSLLASFLIIQIFSIVRVKEFYAKQNMQAKFRLHLAKIDAQYLVFKKSLEEHLVSTILDDKNEEDADLIKLLDIDACHISREGLFFPKGKATTRLSKLFCKLFGLEIYKKQFPQDSSYFQKIKSKMESQYNLNKFDDLSWNYKRASKHLEEFKSDQLINWSLGKFNKEILWTKNNGVPTPKLAIGMLSNKNIQNYYFEFSKRDLPQNWKLIKKDNHFTQTKGHINILLASNVFDFDVIYSVSESSVFKEIREFEFTIYLLIALSFVLAIPSWYFMSNAMTKPMQKIFIGLANVRQRKWQKLDIISRNEFGQVMKGFNHMVDRLREKSELSSFVAEQILDLLSNERGELNNQIEDNAAVLFCDIRSFTSISESHDPEKVVDMLNSYFEMWQLVVQKRGGVIERFIGDAIVVIFFERFSKQYAQDAVQCAMDIMSQMSSFNKKCFQTNDFTIKNGIGISQGKIRFSVIGDKIKKHLFASGEAVIRAEHLEYLSKQGNISMIMVDQYIYQTTQYQFDYQKLENNALDTTVYELKLDRVID